MITDYSRVISNIHENLRTKIINDKIKALVIGESGGIDSALCTVLAKPVCDIPSINTRLIGRSIPIETNKDDERIRAERIGYFFCTDFEEKDLTEMYQKFYPYIMEDEISYRDGGLTENYENQIKIRKGNIKARIRMMYLYDIARHYDGMVLSTDNFTELLAGFWTLHGDVGDYGMIQNLWKTEVYGLAKYICENNYEGISPEAKDALYQCILANPTDGLGISNSDLDQLGVATYAEADEILTRYRNGDTSVEKHPIILRFKATEFKRNNPYNIPREELLKAA